MLAVCAAVFLALQPAPPEDPVAVARQHFSAAEAAERRGDYKTALMEYIAAYGVKPHPSVLYNIATVFEHLNELEEAAHYYQRYLEALPNAPDADAVRARQAALRARPSRVSVDSTPAGANISLDGAPQCTAPCEFQVVSGPHEIGAGFPGQKFQHKKITAEFGRPFAVSFAARVMQGTLVVRSIPDGATISVDDADVGTAPLEIDLPVGLRRVGARLPGYRTRIQTIEVGEGQKVDVSSDLAPLGALTAQVPATPVEDWTPPRLVANPAVIDHPAPPEVRTVPHALYGLVGGPNALHADSSWGGGFSIGLQTPGEGFDVELAVLFPVLTTQLDFRWYLVTDSVFRPFLVFGSAFVIQSVNTMPPAMPPSSPSFFYAFNGGAGFSIDLRSVVFYVEGLANDVLSSAQGDRLSVPILGGMYLRR